MNGHQDQQDARPGNRTHNRSRPKQESYCKTIICIIPLDQRVTLFQAALWLCCSRSGTVPHCLTKIHGPTICLSTPTQIGPDYFSHWRQISHHSPHSSVEFLSFQHVHLLGNFHCRGLMSQLRLHIYTPHLYSNVLRLHNKTQIWRVSLPDWPIL